MGISGFVKATENVIRRYRGYYVFSLNNILTKYVSEFGENVFLNGGSIHFCKLCEIRVYAVEHLITTLKK